MRMSARCRLFQKVQHAAYLLVTWLFCASATTPAITSFENA